MFDDVDEALRKLLLQEIPIRNNEVEIAFDQPKREWSARLNRPTLNVFLHDIRENVKLRQSYMQRPTMNPATRSVALKRPEVRVDLHYMITAWAAESDDEHRLLARTLLAFLRNPELPEAVLPASLQSQPRPIAVTIAQYDSALNPTDIWSVLDNELRPALALTVTLTLEPHEPIEVPAVRSRELRLSDLDVQSMRPQPSGSVSLDGRVAGPEYWTVGGVIRLPEPLDAVELRVVELNEDVAIDAEGRFVIGRLRPGSYTLELKVNGRESIQHHLVVPAEDYDIDWDGMDSTKGGSP